jgi:hypothetical protein
MNLAKIQHYRCGQPESVTLVWVPTDMTENELDALIKTAQQDCVDAEKKVEGQSAPPYRTYWDWLSKADKSKTVSELEAEYAEHKATYDTWAAKRDAARKSFAQRLKDLSNGRVAMFWDEECPLETDCNWGHNHGVKVDYGETDF